MEHKDHDKEAEENIRRIVAEHGWFMGAFEADTATPAFVYTIGLWENYKQPEIIAFGLSIEMLQSIIADSVDNIKESGSLEVDKDIDGVLSNFPIQFKKVHPDNIPDYFGYGMWFYDYQAFPVVQLFWPDKSGLFPWNENFNQNLKFNQPLLYEKLEFKFFEERNVATFVERSILKENTPILTVYHDNEGEWQFLTNEDVAPDNIMLVALEEVVKRDPTINNLFNMPTGQVAVREDASSKWVRKRIED